MSDSNHAIAKKSVELMSGHSCIFVCANCLHMQKAHDKGSSSCGMIDCGSPLSQRDFPDYDGPLTIEYLERVCFITGDQADVAVRLAGSKLNIGLSKTHLHLLEDRFVDFILMPSSVIIENEIDGRVPNLALILNGSDLDE